MTSLTPHTPDSKHKQIWVCEPGELRLLLSLPCERSLPDGVLCKDHRLQLFKMLSFVFLGWLRKSASETLHQLCLGILMEISSFIHKK